MRKWLLLWSVVFATLVLAAAAEAQTTDVQEPAMQKQMTADQQANLIRFVKAGLKWVSGDISFDEVVKISGKPQFVDEQSNSIKYVYYEDGMSIRFFLSKLVANGGRPRVESFKVKISDNISTNIPYEEWDGLGLHRIVRGEKIDGVRTEEGSFFAPTGIAEVETIHPKNYVTYGYRLPMPPDSLYDVNAGFSYLGEWINDKGSPVESNFRKPVDLRDIGISRYYLTPEELQQRNNTKREKYGYMNLCTGMICPEAGLWEGWTKDGPTDVLQVRKGDRFDKVRTVAIYENAGSCPMIDGRWMWLCPPQQIAGFTWHGITIRG
jgi:hypothetical protein